LKNAREQIAIVVSEFHAEITEKLLEGALAHFAENALDAEQIRIVRVPGAIEMPLAAQWLACAKYEAIVCLGAVIRGETGHYDHVCQQVSAGCLQVMLSTGIPIIFGVLTTDNLAQAQDRVGGRHGHKGAEAAAAALGMIGVKAALV